MLVFLKRCRDIWKFDIVWDLDIGIWDLLRSASWLFPSDLYCDLPLSWPVVEFGENHLLPGA